MIDFYGDKDNYIHLKFGDVRKHYYFTPEFVKEFPDFEREFSNYYKMEESKFKSPFAVVAYVYKNKIPVSFYYNFSDTPAKSQKEIMEYLVNENSYVGDLTK